MSVAALIRRGAAIVAALVVVPFPAASVHAAVPKVSVSAYDTHPAGLLRITGSGFTAASPITVYIDRAEIALTSSTGRGTFVAYGRVPAGSLPGRHSLVGRDGRGLTGVTQIHVWTPWPMTGFDAAHSGDNIFENVLNPSAVPGMSDVYRYGFGDTPVATAAVADDVAYIPVYASTRFSYVDAITLPVDGHPGILKWKAYVNAGCFSSSPAVVGAAVIFGVGCIGGGGVFALNTATGQELWATPTLAPVGTSSPAIVDGVVFVGDISGAVYALSAATGATQWMFHASGAIISSPAVSAGTVYISSQDHHLYALNTRSGKPVWSADVGAPMESSPAVVGGRLFVGADDGRVYGYDASTGALDWVFQTGGQVRSSPAVADGVVYVGSDDSHVYAIGAVTGQAVWTAAAPAGITAALAVAHGVVYVGVDAGAVMALAVRSGAQLWQGRTLGAHVASPIVADGTVCVTSFGPSYLVGGLDVYALP